MNIEELIIRHHAAHDGVWVVERTKMVEAEMLKKAVERIEELKESLEDAEAQVADWEDHFDEELAETVCEYEGKRDDFAALYDSTLKQLSGMRNSAKAFVTVSDKFLKEGTNEQQ